MKQRIAFGGGCHWCTEAVFQSLRGVSQVDQGFVASTGSNSAFSEAVIVHFDDEVISLKDFIEIHLHTHASTSDHVMRVKYRSAIYTFCDHQAQKAALILESFQSDFEEKLVTEVLLFEEFRASEEQYVNYYYADPERPFCRKYIRPKLEKIHIKFPDKINESWAKLIE